MREFTEKSYFYSGRGVHEKPIYGGNCLKKGTWTVCRSKGEGGLEEKEGGGGVWGKEGGDISMHAMHCWNVLYALLKNIKYENLKFMPVNRHNEIILETRHFDQTLRKQLRQID